MPSVTIPLQDIEQTVLRPSIYQVVSQVMEILEIKDNPKILYAGKRGTLQASGSSMREMEDSNEALFSTDNLLFIEVNENYQTEAVSTSHYHDYDNKPIFLDTNIGLSLRPIYLSSDVEITLNYQSSSETMVRQWISNLYIKAGRGRDIHLVKMNYKYPVSPEFSLLIKDVHQLIETNEGYGDSLENYFNRHRSNRMTCITNQAGEQATVMVGEGQAGIEGLFDFPIIPEKPEFNREKGLWTTRLVFKYNYSRPDGLYLRYPIAVHNQLLPEKYLKHLESVPVFETPSAHYSYGLDAMTLFSLSNMNGRRTQETAYIRIPTYDDFQPEIRNNTASIFLCRVFLEDDNVTLLDLNDLGDYEISPNVLNFLKKEAPYLSQRYQSLFYVECFINGETKADGTAYVTEDLKIKLTSSGSKRFQYHIRLSGIPELNQALYGAYRRLASDTGAFMEVVAAMNELLAIDPDFGKLSDYTRLEPWMYDTVWRFLTGTHQGLIGSPGTTVDQYLNEMILAPSNLLGLITHLDPKVIESYLRYKHRFPQLRQMLGFITLKNKTT